MKLDFKTCCIFILYGVGWPLAMLTNLWNCVLGLINPRQFLEYSFDYNSIKNCWFNRTNFGWYWKCTSLRRDEQIKSSWFLRNLLRFRMIMSLPLAFASCCIHYWCRSILKDEPSGIGVYMPRYLKVIKDGYYNLKEKEYYI